jgi:hypothetical protein
MHYAQAATLAEAWAARAAALTEQLKALARGHGLTHDALAAATNPARRPGAPAVAYLNNPQVAAAVAAARAHIAELSSLPLQAEPEVEALVEASKAYCLCQALYDEVRPMIGCDYCSDWFHWECVGLNPPREDQDHTEVAPPDFK